MTTPTPNGLLVPGPDGPDLVITRPLPGSIRDAWASITEPERTARWMGRWEGIGRPGETIKVQMGFEDDAPWIDVKITECDAPRTLRVQSVSDHGSWDLSFHLTSDGERSELRFIMHHPDVAEVGNVGPGWEYYLDQLVSASTGAPVPEWDDYFPAQKDYFEKQAR